MLDERNHIATEVQSLLRYGAFVAPVLLLIYNLCIQSGIITPAMSAFSTNPQTILLISLVWLALGSMVFLSSSSSRKPWILIVQVILFYIVGAAQTLMISGFASPISTLWVLMLIGTFIALGKRGLKVALLFLIAVLATETLLSYQTHTDGLLAVLTVVAIIVTSLVIIVMYSSQQTSHRQLASSKARENLERDRVVTLINNLTDAVFSADKNGIVRLYNAAALNLLDTNDTVEGRSISEVVRLETTDKKPIDIFDELSRSNNIRQRDDLIMPIDEDDQLRIEATFAPVQGGDGLTPDGYMLILRDITKIKSLEEERDEFISVVSHELRTPITIAEGSLSNAKLMIERGMTSKIEPTINEAHDKVLFLAKMVNDLSTLSRAERGVGDAAELIDLGELAAQLAHEYTPQAEEKGLVFDLDVGGRLGYVKASRLYLQELLQNFITNSIKYTQQGNVKLTIKKVKNEIYFGVSDSGIGISKADQKRIFERFYRAEDYRTRETGGTGLGLYVAAKLAKKLGCKINVQSRLNHGSTFSFTLKSHTKN